MLKNSGVNYVGYIFLNVISAGLFNEVMHNFFRLLIVAVRGEKNANGSAINVVTISGESLLPEINGRVNVFAPCRRDGSVFFRFGFKFVELMLKEIAIGLSNVFFTLKLLILFEE